ncbi:hypothetical protein CRI65_20720 [Escherichia sp. E3659]|nr:hypothetical protein CRI65_20720 [Escherichia sp. E3659]
MKKTAPDGAVSGMPAIRETGPGKNLQAITVSTVLCSGLVGLIRRVIVASGKKRQRTQQTQLHLASNL